MSWNFRRRIGIAKGVNLNISRSGVSASVGSKGAKVTVGKKGAFLNVGIPGTGIYKRSKIASDHQSASHKEADTSNPNTKVPTIGCVVGLLVVVFGFILAFTICDSFSNGAIIVVGFCAFGALIMGISTKIANDNDFKSKQKVVEDEEPVIMQYNPTQIGNSTNRFALVQKGKRTLFVIGLNPSTADSKTPDATMQSVLRIASYNGFDGFIMLNLYPYRATQPYNLPKEFDYALHQENLRQIKELLKDYTRVEVWLAFGANADKRDYLMQCFEDIKNIFEHYNPRWYCIGELTSKGFPKHPLYQKVDYFNEYPMK